MPDIQLRQFDSFEDYKEFMGDRKPQRIPKTYSAANAGTKKRGQWLRSDWGELTRYLWLTMRSDNNTGDDDDSLIFELAEALVKTTLSILNDEYQTSMRYTNMETSIKGNTSFLMGMTAAQMVARRIYHIPLLLHLTDPALCPDIIKSNSSGKGERPDYFGLDSSGTPYLIEAKGTTGRPGSPNVQKAIDQLLTDMKIFLSRGMASQPEERLPSAGCCLLLRGRRVSGGSLDARLLV